MLDVSLATWMNTKIDFIRNFLDWSNNIFWKILQFFIEKIKLKLLYRGNSKPNTFSLNNFFNHYHFCVTNHQ